MLTLSQSTTCTATIPAISGEEEDFDCVLNLMHQLAFSSLANKDIAQLLTAGRCVAQVHDALALAREVVWILEDNDNLKSFNVTFKGRGALVSEVEWVGMKASAGLCSLADTSELAERLGRIAGLSLDQDALDGKVLCVDRDALVEHLDAEFSPAQVLLQTSPEWANSLLSTLSHVTQRTKGDGQWAEGDDAEHEEEDDVESFEPFRAWRFRQTG